MSKTSMNAARAAAAVAAANQQAQAQGQQARQQFRVGHQAAQYKGAMFRTAQSQGKPSGAQAMMTKLKARPRPGGEADGEVQGVRTEMSESIDPDEDGKGGGRGKQQGEGRNESGGERKIEAVTSETSSSEGSSSSGDDEDSSEGGEGGGGRGGRGGHVHGRGMGVRAVGRVRASSGGAGGGGGVNAATAIRAAWADTAMQKGGLVELMRATVDRLLRAARGSDITSWRKDWMGTMGAAYGALYAFGGAGEDSKKAEVNASALLNDRSKAVPPPPRMLPHKARETMFCLMWLATHHLKCPRTPTQVKEMMPCLAALVRISNTRKSF